MKICNTCVSGLNTLFGGTDVAKMDSHQMHQFYSIRPTMLFWSVFKNFKNLRNVKIYKTCVLVVNAIFQGTEVAKRNSHEMHGFYSLGPKMMFGSVLEHLGNLRNVKRCKTYVSCMNALFLRYRNFENGVAPNAPSGLPWTQNVFRGVLEHFVNNLHVKRNKTFVLGMNTLFWGTKVAKIVSHHASILIPWTYNDVCVCFGAFGNLRNVK
jgi:hypothetical protein